MMFNNMIYGLTKGQYSPTSEMGSVTKSSPQGTIEHAFNPGELVIGSQGTFFARSIDTNPKLMSEILIEAYKHNGTSMIEILQNCVIFNDKVHSYLTSKETKHDNQLILKHGEPMIFGKEKDKGIVLDGLKLKVVKIGENGISKDDILVHDQHEEDPTLALMLIRMAPPKFPVALGVIRAISNPVYENQMEDLIVSSQSSSEMKGIDDLLNSGNTWEI
jgi:2-oxoglutarate ferredoxin oxidoreductase subunit beta